MDGEASPGGNDAPDDDLKIKGVAASKTKILTDRNAGKGSETCAICLETITERAVATPCNHLLFDFLCLVSWLQEQSNCPLCKAEVKEVQYDWRSAHDYKTYHVPRLPAQTLIPQDRRRRPVALVISPPAADADPSVQRRRHVYRHRLYSFHVGSNRFSQYREFSATEFAHSAELQSRARTFLRRELQIFVFLDNREFLMEYIVAVLKRYDTKAAEGRAVELVREFLGESNAEQLLHELHTWLRSPFKTLRGWDDQVRYPDSNEGVVKTQR